MKDLLCFNEEQVLTNINNICSIMKIPKPKLVFNGKIKTKYKTARLYQLFESEHSMYFIIVYSDSFNIQFFQSCIYFEDIMKDWAKTNGRPKVYICSAFLIPKHNIKLLTSDLLTCSFRFVMLSDIHPITGSSTLLPAHIKSYELLDTKEKAFNNRDFPLIRDSDPVVKILNALPDDLIRAHEIICDNGKPFTQFKIRRVISEHSTIRDIPSSGLVMKTN